MDNRYYVKIRLYEDLPDMPHSGKYLEFMIEAKKVSILIYLKCQTSIFLKKKLRQ